MARKNGKTATIACLLLAHIAGPEAEQNSQIVSGARSRDQAALVFDLAAKMVRMSPTLSRLVRILDAKKRLVGLTKNVEYRAMSAESSTAHGLSPILAILDEVGQVEGATDAFIDAITTAQGAHANPLLIAISTQAPSDGALFSIWLDDAKTSEDLRIVSHVYSAPDGCHVEDEKAWKASNPALGVFRSRADLAEQAAAAKRMPSAQNSFRVLCLNQRVNMNSPLFPKDEWLKRSRDVEWVENEGVWLALDLSAKTDLTALVGVSDEDDDRVQAWFFKPEDLIETHERRDRFPYQRYVDEGWIEAIPGRIIHPRAVALRVAELTERYNVLGLAYDRWQIDHLLREFDAIGLQASKAGEGDGLQLHPWGQGFKEMSPAIDALETSIMTDKLQHPGNPVLTWNIANAVVTTDPAGGRKMDKSKARFRIDGAVALSMAVGLKARERGGDGGSVYEERGLLII